MNLPQLTALIGEQIKASMNINNELAMLVKTTEAKEKDKKPHYVYLTFDLPNQQIRIDEPIAFNENQHIYEFNYFGNNSAAGSQYYVTRDVSGSLHYLLTSTLSDLAMVLLRNNLDQGVLYTQLRKLEEQKLITIGAKVGQGSVSLDRIQGFEGSTATVDKGKKKIIVDGQELSFEAFVFRALGLEAKVPYKIVLITPRIITTDHEVLIIAQHPDYIAATKREQKLEMSSSKRKSSEKLCYICHEMRPDASSKLTTNFSRKGINKIFTTTTINASKQINARSYDYNYAICTECYKYLLFGEQAIASNFQSRIAGERAFIIPEGLEGEFEYEHLIGLKEKVDLAFSTKVTEEWLGNLELEQGETLDGSAYLVHILLYRTGGKSVTVLEAFEDVPVLHIRKVIETLATHSFRLQPRARGMKLDDIYRLIPVHTNKKGEQLDIHRVLTIYKSLMCKYRLDAHILFQYATEALDKGLKQLAKEQSAQFPNMRLSWFRDKIDYFINHVIMKYICLIQTFQTLGLLEWQPFDLNKEGMPLTTEDNKRDLIEATEHFLESSGFNPEQRGLFYLGALLNKIGSAQYRKDHKHKPILNKIQYQGMSRNEIIRLYNDAREKVMQYARGESSGWQLDCDRLGQKFHHYSDKYIANPDSGGWSSEQQNVFFVMSGYSFMVQYYSKNEILHSDKGDDENDQE